MAELCARDNGSGRRSLLEDGECAWYALHTRYQHEKLVATILREKGFEVFLPLYEARHTWQDRIKQLSLPLFPSYLFIREGLDRRLQIVSTPGICNIVGCGGVPAPIPAREIGQVRRVIESRLSVEPYPFLKSGDLVRLKSGPLTGLEGILVRKKNATRLIVSVEMLGKSAAVEVDGACVERVHRKDVKSASHEAGTCVLNEERRMLTGASEKGEWGKTIQVAVES